VIVPPRQALEISSAEDYPDGQTRFLKAVPTDDCVAFPSLVVSWLVLLTLVGIAVILFRLIGRMFVTLPFCLHSTFCALSSHVQLSRSSSEWKSRVLTSIGCLLDIVLLGLIYPKVWTVMIDVFFTDVDGTVVIEWTDERFALRVITLLGQVMAWLRLLFGTYSWMSRIDFFVLPSWLATACTSMKPACSQQIRQPCVLRLANVALSVSFLCLVWSLYSTVVHFYPWSPPSIVHAECDPMDVTECWLPFPSMEFMKRDPNTTTGWRVHLQGNLLPPLKGRIPMDPAFLNELDGFSTMGSILFYMVGLKEAHDAGVGQLQGPASIAASVTPQSITLLLDVNSSKLVAHSAEIDYLDSARPLVMVFPAQPLKHGNHYAMAVVNATDELGNVIEPSAHLTFLTTLASEVGSNQQVMDRANRFNDIVIPALELAAPWVSVTKQPGILQMLFDFVTVSEDAQLGPVRAVRDATLAHVASASWSDWGDHVRLVRKIDNDCSQSLIARTIHADIDVPWFLEGYGRGHRGAVLDAAAVSHGIPTAIGAAKFVLHIPCSLRHAASGANDRDAKPIRAVMEYGHGLFYNRQEASETFLQQMAHDEGYVIMAMDWRGMSVFDLLVVAKVLLSRPRLFQAVRDNLIQGYANKFALLHFSQNGMLSMDWFRFESSSQGDNARIVPTFNNKPPVPVFYGISQGGILGAGYVALSGATELLDRAILGVPGTPFALVMTRSLDFVGYDLLLLLNFYDNRHVRELLALVQMAWDSVEGSGVLAPPIREPCPRMLLQAGLGDSVVPSIAAEALARGLNASILPNNPRSIYNVPVAGAVDNTSDGPSVILTELLYEKEYASLPMDDTRMEGNSVHVCVRLDPAMIRQISEFINSGQVLDVCANDGCRREHSC
jgi:hypothetical protein